MTDEQIEAVARAIAEELGDGFDNAFAHKGEWIDGRGVKGGRYRDVNEPLQCDYLAAARAALVAAERVAWQPIETLEPGRRALLWPCLNGAIGLGWIDPIDKKCRLYMAGDLPFPPVPTKWRPLPEPPQA